MLSPRQQDAYRFIRDYIRRHGHGPSLAEISAALGIRSRGVAHRYVRALAAAGHVILHPGRHRGISLPEDGDGAGLSLPLLGRIAAGRPIEAIHDQQEIDLSEFFMGERRFVLRVQGDSMVDAGILSGDMVVVESRDHARDGEIVVALIDGEEATLKRIRHNPDGSLTLIPANRALSPTTYSAGRIRIQGAVVAQLRSYR